MNAAFVQDTARNSERERDDRGKSRGTRVQGKGFRLSSANNTESEDSLREKEHNNVKVGLYACTHYLYVPVHATKYLLEAI